MANIERILIINDERSEADADTLRLLFPAADIKQPPLSALPPATGLPTSSPTTRSSDGCQLRKHPVRAARVQHGKKQVRIRPRTFLDSLPREGASLSQHHPPGQSFSNFFDKIDSTLARGNSGNISAAAAAGRERLHETAV